MRFQAAMRRMAIIGQQHQMQQTITIHTLLMLILMGHRIIDCRNWIPAFASEFAYKGGTRCM